MNKTNTTTKLTQEKWTNACKRAEAALNELVEMQLEVQNVYDDMSERQQGSDRGVELSWICDIMLEDALISVQDAVTNAQYL